MKCERCITQVEGQQIDDCVNGYKLKKMICSSCSNCRAVTVEDKWETIEDIINDHHPDGFRDALGPRDAIIHYVLSQILYASDLDDDPSSCLFDKPDPGDKIRLLVMSGQIVGFYTIKPKGTRIEYSHETYTLPTLDTVYVNKRHRGKGLAGLMLEDLVLTYPHQDIGVSKPISARMLKVFQKYLHKRPEERFKFWEIDGAGGEGRKKLLYLEILRIKK